MSVGGLGIFKEGDMIKGFSTVLGTLILAMCLSDRVAQVALMSRGITTQT